MAAAVRRGWRMRSSGRRGEEPLDSLAPLPSWLAALWCGKGGQHKLRKGPQRCGPPIQLIAKGGRMDTCGLPGFHELLGVIACFHSTLTPRRVVAPFYISSWGLPSGLNVGSACPPIRSLLQAARRLVVGPSVTCRDGWHFA